MKKLLIFVMALTFMAQATVSFADTIWPDSNKLATQLGVTSTGSIDSVNGSPNGTTYIGWGSDGEFWTSHSLGPMTNQQHTIGDIHYRIPRSMSASHAQLDSFDYTMNVSFGDKTGIAGFGGTMHVDHVLDGTMHYFIIDPSVFTAFSKTFVVDGIEYETRLQLSTLKGDKLAWAQNYLGVGSDVTIFGWASDRGVQGTMYFHLQIRELNAVPVPAAVWLMGTGVAGLVALKRRNSAK